MKFVFWAELQKTMDRKKVVRWISIRHCLARTIIKENTKIQKQQQQNTMQKKKENKRVSNNLETTLYKRKRTVIVKRWSFTLVIWIIKEAFAQITGMRVWSKLSQHFHSHYFPSWKSEPQEIDFWLQEIVCCIQTDLIIQGCVYYNKK